MRPPWRNESWRVLAQVAIGAIHPNQTYETFPLICKVSHRGTGGRTRLTRKAADIRLNIHDDRADRRDGRRRTVRPAVGAEPRSPGVELRRGAPGASRIRGAR